MSDVRYTRLLYKNEELFSSDIRTVIHQGGTGSSKTYSNLQYILNLAMQIDGEVFSIVSESIPHLDRGVIKDSKDILRIQSVDVPFNETKRFFSFKNGSKVEFFSADRTDIATGPRRFFLYGNEINSFKLDVWSEMARRSKFVLADFNPTQKFWLEDWLNYQKSYQIVKSNYKDNNHLPKNEREDIQLRAEIDSNFRRVHIDCEYGNSENLVFEQKNIILIDEFPKDIKHNYGLDFGFVAPSSLVKVGLVGRDLYIEELMYSSGLDTFQLISQIKTLTDGTRINADSADSRMINELQQNKINVHGAVKKGVVEGINYLKGLKIHITKNSVNTIKEFRNLMNGKLANGDFSGKFIGADHCFVAETKVKTINGYKRIIDLRKNDLVLTTNGYKKVLNVWDNGIKNVKKYKIDIGNCANITYLCCTKNHKIKINNKWKQISKLKKQDKIYLNKNLEVKFTNSIKAKNITQSIQQECIQQFGNTIMGKFQMAIIYIILTAILQIIKLKTFALKRKANIYQNTQKFGTKIIKKKRKNILTKLEFLQKNGIQVKMAGIGTGNTQKNVALANKVMEWLIAKFVKSNLKRNQFLKNFALTNVKVNIEGCQELMMKKENVIIAENYLKQINILKLNFVQEVAVHHLEVSSEMKRKVYDLEVDENSEYFAENILVHNSVDAVRYAIETEKKSENRMSFSTGRSTNIPYEQRYK